MSFKGKKTSINEEVLVICIYKYSHMLKNLTESLYKIQTNKKLYKIY